MELLASRKASLICAVINAVWALNSFTTESYFFGFLAIGFCALCTRNYLKS